ncbi:MAG: RNA methyltransferase [Prevotella sp.]|nr:RNA methyltransferase [Prevotella sp.]
MISKNQIKYIRQLELKKYRRRENVFVAEGPKVVGDLLRRYQPIAVYATSEWRQETGDRSLVTEISDDELRRISFLQHPQQVLALFPIPTINYPLSIIHSTLSLALDGIQDPGNLGTIIRIADWFGIGTIYCSEDTADAYNPKVVQATMGSIAHVNIVYTDLLKLFDSLPPSYPVYGTLLDGEDIYQQPLSNEGIIVMGNEGNGISEAIRQRVNRRLLIPCFRKGDTAESLNVAIATAITCSEFKRRQ